MLRSGLCRDILIIADDYYLRLGLETLYKRKKKDEILTRLCYCLGFYFQN